MAMFSWETTSQFPVVYIDRGSRTPISLQTLVRTPLKKQLDPFDHWTSPWVQLLLEGGLYGPLYIMLMTKEKVFRTRLLQQATIPSAEILGNKIKLQTIVLLYSN